MKMIKLLFINLFLLIMAIIFSGVSLNAKVQNGELMINFDFKEIPLRNALNYLINQYVIPLAYQEEQVEGIMISVRCDSQTVEQALGQLLKNTSLSCQKVGKQFVLSKSESINKTTKSNMKIGRNVIRGFVRDKANGETLPYVNVVIVGTGLGDAADENGYYVITQIPDGKFTVKAMMIGYKVEEKEVNFFGGKTVTHDFYLQESIIQGETIIKTAERERFERQIEPSKIQMSRREIEAVPAFVEADLFRSIQMLPGVVSQSDFSSALYIRGGNPSENMILLDDVRIYNPYHFGAVFSTFNTDAIKNVDVSLGGFPSRYGNATSSVISITNKDGNSQKFETKGSVSLLSSKLLLESPIPNGSILLSGRRTYFDVIYNVFFKGSSNDPDSDIPYYFYDFHGKINYAFSPNSKITLSGFYGDDVLSDEESHEEFDRNLQQYRVVGTDRTDIRFGNFCSTLKWQHIFSPRLFSEFILAKSRFRVRLDGDYYGDESVHANDIINDYTFRSDLTYFLSKKHELKFGLEYQRLLFEIFMKVNEFKLIDYERKSNFYSGYFQDDWKVSPRLNIQTGARFTYYSLGDYSRIDPRVSVRYRLKHNVNLKGSFGVFHQYFYTFNPEDIDFLNYIRLIDLWFPIDQRYQPIRAKHYIGGFEYLLDDDYTFSIEGYYKDYDHLLDLNELGDKGEDDDFLLGWGRAAGLEFLLRKQSGNFTGWIGYSLAFTERTIETAQASNRLTDKSFEKEYQSYFPNHDRRHSLTCVASYQLSDKWKFSSRFTFCSGLPETPTIGWKNHYDMGDEKNAVQANRIPVKAEKNSMRLPSYIRWDVSLMRNFSFRKWSLQPFLQIINLTNHRNIFLYEYALDGEYASLGNQSPAKRKGIPMFPFIPTIGVNFQF